MGCNCRKNRQVYTGPPVPTDQSVNQTGGQTPIQPTPHDSVTADGRPTTAPQ